MAFEDEEQMAEIDEMSMDNLDTQIEEEHLLGW